MSDTEAKLRQVITKVAEREWIIGTAYEDSTRNFGWRVNVLRDPEAQTHRYDPMPGTFALNPADSGLLGLSVVPREEAR